MDERELKLRAEHLHKSYNGRAVVSDVSFEVSCGEIVGLLGPNGAGKTTSFYMCVGLVSPSKGKVFLGDSEVTQLPVYQRARLGMGYLPQEASVFRKLSVEDNIMAILETMSELGRAARKERLEQLLEELGIQHIRKTAGNALSGGERRRVEIARTLARNPKFILLDEPFAGIDPIAVRELQQLISSLQSRGIGVLITDHNVRETLKICERAYILFEGRILEAGSPGELARSEQAQRAYLGEDFSLH